MLKIVGITGAHGTGKSMMLKALAALNLPDVVVDTVSMPRATQDKLGISIADLATKPELAPRFQDALLSAKIEHLQHLRDQYAGQNVTIYTDRTPADFYSYACDWTRLDVDYANWLKAYTSRCTFAMAAYDTLVLVPIRKFPFVEELQRAPVATQKANHASCKRFARKAAIHIHMIRHLDVQQRVAELLSLKAL